MSIYQHPVMQANLFMLGDLMACAGSDKEGPSLEDDGLALPYHVEEPSEDEAADGDAGSTNVRENLYSTMRQEVLSYLDSLRADRAKKKLQVAN